MSKSATHEEYAGEGYYVTIQHCEHTFENGRVCNMYLGVNYPSDRCRAHERPSIPPISQPTPS